MIYFFYNQGLLHFKFINRQILQHLRKSISKKRPENGIPEIDVLITITPNIIKDFLWQVIWNETESIHWHIHSIYQICIIKTFLYTLIKSILVAVMA